MIRFQVGLIKKFTNKFTNILPKKEIVTTVKPKEKRKCKHKSKTKRTIKGKFTFVAPYVTVAEQLACPVMDIRMAALGALLDIAINNAKTRSAIVSIIEEHTSKIIAQTPEEEAEINMAKDVINKIAQLYIK